MFRNQRNFTNTRIFKYKINHSHLSIVFNETKGVLFLKYMPTHSIVSFHLVVTEVQFHAYIFRRKKEQAPVFSLKHIIEPPFSKDMIHGTEKLVIWWCKIGLSQLVQSLKLLVSAWLHWHCVLGHSHSKWVRVFDWPMLGRKLSTHYLI